MVRHKESVFSEIHVMFFPSFCQDYTDLSVGTVTQTQAIPYTGPISLLVSQLRSLTGE